MKKLFFMLALASLTTGAYASKARLEAFGESKYGSFIIDDYRNIYLNMAAINDYQNYATIELGGATTNTDGGTTPKGEAGVTFGHGDMTYGIHYGYYSDALSLFRKSIMGIPNLTAAKATTGGNTYDISAQDVVDFMIGSKTANMKWGAAFQISNSKDESTTGEKVEQSAMATRFGVEMGKLRVGAIVALNNSVKMEKAYIDADADGTTDTQSATVEFKGKLGFEVNGSYDLMQDYRVFGRVQMQKAEGTNLALTELKYTRFELGAAKTYHFKGKNFMFAKFAINSEKTTATFTGGTNEEKNLYAPLTIGVEGYAKEWLALRAAASMNIYSSTEEDNSLVATDGGKVTGLGTTSLSAGASLIFGDLTIDGALATAGTGQLKFDDVLTRVSLTYNF